MLNLFYQSFILAKEYIVQDSNFCLNCKKFCYLNLTKLTLLGIFIINLFQFFIQLNKFIF